MDEVYTKLGASSIIFLGNLILAGIGGSVYVFCTKKKKLLSKTDVLTKYKIHGLSFNSGYLVLAYGGKEVSIFKILEADSETKLTEKILLKEDDWVVHSIFIDSNSHVATLSAHGVVTIWSLKENTKLGQVLCEEQSILYSGLVIGCSSSDLICFGGTVFGEVAIWSVQKKDHQRHQNKCPVMHSLRGHKGAIFSISYNPESNIICTSSDDRSVRWWYVSWPSCRKESSSNFKLWSAANFCLISVCFGHLARVWKCLPCKSFTFTVGEDSQICVWKNLEICDIQNDKSGAVEFPLVARKQILNGGSIWSLDFSYIHGLVLALEDGGIFLWNMATFLCPSSILSLCLLRKDDPYRRVCFYGKNLQPLVMTKNGEVSIATGLEDSSPNWKNILEDERCIGLSLLDTSRNRKSVAITSSNGDVIVISGKSEIRAREDVKSFAKVKLSEGYALSIHWLSDDLLLTCNSVGKLQLWLLLQNEGTVELQEANSWILPQSKQRWTTAAVWIPWGAAPGFILCGNRTGDLLLFSGRHSEPIQIMRNVHGHMGITSFLVAGYNKNNSQIPSYQEVYGSSDELDVESISRCGESVVIYSTGRNGVLNLYVLQEGLLKKKGSERLGFDWAARSVMHNNNVFVFGFKEASAVLWGLKERCVLLEKNCGGGHRSWDLDFINQNNETLLFRLALIKNGKLTLVNWKMPIDSLDKNILQEGLHSKEINCVKCFNLTNFQQRENSEGDIILIISGSEDTTAKVSTFSTSCDGDSLTTICTLYGHLSSVRTLYALTLPFIELKSDDGENSEVELVDKKKEPIGSNFQYINFMLFTAGGRAQLKAWKLSFKQPNLQEGESGKDMNFKECRVEEHSSLLLGTKKYGQKQVPNDPEARFMDICAFFPIFNRDGKYSSTRSPIVIAAACSDGFLRLFGLAENNISRRNSLLGLWSQGVPNQDPGIKRHCLFRVLHHEIYNRHILLTTDCIGYFHLWDVTHSVESMRKSFEDGDLSRVFMDIEHTTHGVISPFYSKLAHQFSINAVDWIIGNSGSKKPSVELSALLTVATGGEDGTLALHFLELSRKSHSDPWTMTSAQSWSREFVMPTQISGLKIVSDEYLVTVSKNQTVGLWQLKYDPSNSQFYDALLISEYFTFVPDIQDMYITKTRDSTYACISGCGIEIIRLSLPNE